MFRPVVLHPILLPGFLRYIIDHHTAPTSLIVCSSRMDFERHLIHAIETDESLDSAELLLPTIHNIFVTSTVRVAFCPSLAVLRAHLSSLTSRPALASPSTTNCPNSTTSAIPILALLNPVALLKGTVACSAQGLSRTLAIAVEAAVRAGQKLVVAECPVPGHLCQREKIEYGGGSSEHVMLDDCASIGDHASSEAAEPEEDPWAENLSIVDVFTKSFGIGGRVWTDRTVKARATAEQWCCFERPP